MAMGDNVEYFGYIFYFIFSFISTPAYAAANIDVSSLNLITMLQNLSTQIPMLMRLITAFAYVLGMIFIFIALVKLKHFGESRTMMSQEHGMMGPIIYFVIGTALLYLPSSVQVGMSTFWRDPSPYAYETVGTDQWSLFMGDIFLIVQLIGTISFIRGLVILSKLGGHGGQEGLGKGITHIIAGIFCINIYQFVQVVASTFGIQVNL